MAFFDESPTLLSALVEQHDEERNGDEQQSKANGQEYACIHRITNATTIRARARRTNVSESDIIRRRVVLGLGTLTRSSSISATSSACSMCCCCPCSKAPRRTKSCSII